MYLSTIHYRKINMEKFGKFKFQLLKDDTNMGWYYQIYFDNSPRIISVSIESFKTEGIARYAAIGHIELIKKNSTNFGCEP